MCNLDFRENRVFTDAARETFGKPHFGRKNMSHFENDGTDLIGSFGVGKTREEIEQEAERKERAEAFLAEEKKRKEKESKIEADRAVLRQEEIIEKRVVSAIMEANPNFSQYEARRLYSEKLREIVAIRQFEIAFFGSPDKTRAIFSGVKM